MWKPYLENLIKINLNILHSFKLSNWYKSLIEQALQPPLRLAYRHSISCSVHLQAIEPPHIKKMAVLVDINTYNLKDMLETS